MRNVHRRSRLASYIGVLSASLALGSAGLLAQTAEEPPEGITNYTRIDATVACAGATPATALPGLKQLGFKSIINFRTEEEEGANIQSHRSTAAVIGLKYIHIPFRAPTPEKTEEFLAAISDTANQPAYIHCASANRVGAMWFIKRVKLDAWDTDAAMTEAETIGLRSERLKEFALDYVSQ